MTRYNVELQLEVSEIETIDELTNELLYLLNNEVTFPVQVKRIYVVSPTPHTKCGPDVV